MPNEKWLRRPLIDPLLLVLKSRRVVVAFASLLVGLLILAVPTLEAVRAELLALVIALGLAIIGGYSMEEAARLGRERAAQSPHELRELIKQLLVEVLDEVLEAKKEATDV